MATMQELKDAVDEYYGASEQDPPEDSVINLALQGAIDAINNIRLYEPATGSLEVVEDKYAALAQRIAVYLCSKEGVEGATKFSENGVSRTYRYGDIPNTMLSQVTPMCKGWY